MPATLRPAEVLALAPDAPSVRRARWLATARSWVSTGATGTLVWGECQGTDDEPYRTSAEASAKAFACTCPSSKFPCKHALGLLLRWANGLVPEVPAGGAPGWARPTEAEQGVLRVRKPVDPEAQARRAAARIDRMGAGMAELDQWLRDVARRGLAAVQAEGPDALEVVAARLVDAQAPGAASLVRRLAWTMRGGEGWEVRAVSEVGRLWLLAQGWARLAALPPALADEVRAVAGWSRTAEEVAAGPAVRDRWSVVGRWQSPPWMTDQVRVQRTWLWGQHVGRPALLLDFAPPNGSFQPELEPGTVVDADVAFYPGAWPHRAALVACLRPPELLVEPVGWPTLDAGLAAHAEALAHNPWLERWPLVLQAAAADPSGLRDGDGHAVDLREGMGDRAFWRLVALSGGHPVGVAGEWEDGRFLPLAAVAGGRFVAL